MKTWIKAATCCALVSWAWTTVAAGASAPFELRAGREAALLAAGGLLGGAALVVQHGQSPLDGAALDRLDAADINAFDRGVARCWSVSASGVSDGLAATLLLAPVGFALAGGFDDARAAPLAMYAETLLLTGSITQLLKGSVSRTRPYVYNDDPAIPLASKLSADARRSFPSSHAANAFAAAVFLGRMHDAYNPESRARSWVWAGAFAAATTVATLRCTAGRHFPTDVLTGAAIGGAAGWVVPQLHRSREGDRIALRLDRGIGLSLRF